MKKILILLIILLTGCQKTNTTKLYLEEKYYKESKYIEVSAKDIEKLKNETYLIYTYNNYCSLKIPCDTIFKKVMDKYNITILSIPYEETKGLFIYKTVKYAPSIIIVQKNKVVAYLDPDNNDDYNKYQDENEFEKWLNNYIYLSA